MKTWKSGQVRACRTAWDGDSFSLVVEMVNRADRGKRSGVLAVRSDDFPEWQNIPGGPVKAGSKELIIATEVAYRPKTIQARAKVKKGDKSSSWGRVVRLDRLNIC